MPSTTCPVSRNPEGIQTFGNQAANYHPHGHYLAADGLFLSDGAFHSPTYPQPIDIAELFRRSVLEASVQQELIPREVARNMLSWPHHGFHVHFGPWLLPDDGDSLGATARYAARAPVSLSRLHYDRENQQVAYSYTSTYDKQQHIERLSPQQFITRLSTHIPNQYERSIHCYGVYSSRSQGDRRVRASGPERGEVEKKPPPTQCKRQWQQLLQRVFHPTLTCPICNTDLPASRGQAGMKIIAVITPSEPICLCVPARRQILKTFDHLKSKKIDPRAGPFAEQAA